MVYCALRRGTQKKSGQYNHSRTTLPVRCALHALAFGPAHLLLLLVCVLGLALHADFATAATGTGVQTQPQMRPARGANTNGPNDVEALILGAREEAKRKPYYRSAYYTGGYPPPHEGVCTDVIWRAFKHAGYHLKDMMDKDIRANPKAYPRVAGKPDPNIDFRRVPNMTAFFSRHARTLTKTIKPDDAANLASWQGGDIVVFANPDHIGILSDKRNRQGIPLLLHNDGPWASEADDFMLWYNRGIVAHFRFFK